MKKVLYLTIYDNDGTAFYRIAPLKFINHPEITVERKPYSGNISWEFFIGYDIFFLERPSSQNDLMVIKLAKQCGLKVVSDWDDDCLHLDIYNPMYATYEALKSTVMECIALSDEIWVSTVGIRKSFGLLNSNIQVIPNCHNDYLFPIDKKKEFNKLSKKVVWRGGASHEADVYEYSEKLVEVINENTDWSFQFIGHRFIWLEQRCGDNYQPVSQMPLLQYFEYLNNENPNIVFHSLSDTIFNQCKSNIAWIEATYSGAAFFGNGDTHTEFNMPGIADVGHLSTEFEQDDLETLKEANECSWKYIMNNLLLSNINKIRIERILSI